jgi:hypothetical protein
VGKKPANNEFDPKAFLARVGAGKTILKIKKNQRDEQGETWRVRFFTFKRAGSS